MITTIMKRTLALTISLFALAGCADDTGDSSSQTPLTTSTTSDSVVTPTGLVAESIRIDVKEEEWSYLPIAVKQGEQFELVNAPEFGQLEVSSGSIQYLSNPNYVGQDRFSYQIVENGRKSNIATVTIQVINVNDLPTVQNISITGEEDQSLTFDLLGQDVDFDALSFDALTQPKNGTVTILGDQATYQPTQNFSGTDNFTYIAMDQYGSSDAATVEISLSAKNDSPIAQDFMVTTKEDQPVSFEPKISDVDGDTLSLTIVAKPQFGELTISNNRLRYVPNSNAFGEDQFSYIVIDSLGEESARALVTIVVEPVNDKPVSQALNYEVDEDSSLLITPQASDADNDSLSYLWLAQPSQGQLTKTIDGWVYKPTANFNGSDQFYYHANDGQGFSARALVRITVNAVDDAPVANDRHYSLIEDVPTAVKLSATDVDRDQISYQVLSQPLHGKLTGTAPNLIYTPNSAYVGLDEFSYTAKANGTTSATAKVTIAVIERNDPPVISGQNLGTNEDEPLVISFTGSDPEGEPVSFEIVSRPRNGVLTGTGSQRTYQPAADFFGTDSFTVKAYDGAVYSQPVTVSVTVAPVNDAPKVVAATFKGTEDRLFGFYIHVIDPDRDSISIEVVEQGSLGTATQVGLNTEYEPLANQFGTDTIKVRAFDGQVYSEVTDITVEITAVDDAPVAQSASYTINEDEPITFTLQVEDIDSSNIQYNIFSNVNRGTLTGTAPNFVYTPNQDYHGSDRLYFNASADGRNTGNKTISFTIDSVNDLPQLLTKQVWANPDQTLDFTLQTADAERHLVRTNLITAPELGTLVGSGVNYQYTPQAEQKLAQQAVFELTDGIDSARYTLDILINQPPSLLGQQATINEDSSYVAQLSGSDPDKHQLSYHVASAPLYGNVEIIGDQLTYTPNPDYFGDDQFELVANDGHINSAPALFKVSMLPMPDQPKALNQTVDVFNVHPVNIYRAGFDPDGGAIAVNIINDAQHGQLDTSSEPWVYKSNPGFVGQDSVSFTVSNDHFQSQAATVTIDVQGVTTTDIFMADEAACYRGSAGLECWGWFAEEAEQLQGRPHVKKLVNSGERMLCGLDGINDAYLQPFCAGNISYGLDQYPLTNAPIDIAAAYKFACVIDLQPNYQRVLNCWGAGLSGVKLPTLKNPTALYGYGNGICAADEGKLHCFGPQTGQFITQVPNMLSTDVFSFNGDGGCRAVPELDNAIECWGSHRLYGNSNQFDGITGVSDLSLGGESMCAIYPDADGANKVQCWGDLQGSEPVLQNPQSIAAYGQAACVEDERGLFCWSANSSNDDVLKIPQHIVSNNTAPIANHLTVRTTDNVPVEFDFPVSDADGDKIQIIGDVNSLNGTLEQVQGTTYRFTPARNRGETGYYNFYASDGRSVSDLKRVTFEIDRSNAAPIVQLPEQGYTQPERPLKIYFVAKDASNEVTKFTYRADTSTTQGSVTFNAPYLTFTPQAGFSGTTSFSMQAADQDGNWSEPVSISIDVDPRHLPVSQPILQVAGDTLCWASEEMNLQCINTKLDILESAPYVPGAKFLAADAASRRTTCVASSSEVHCIGTGKIPSTVQTVDNLKSITTQSDYVCLVDKNGPQCLGDALTIPTHLSELQNPVQLSAEGGKFCALDSTAEGNKVYCWRDNYLPDGEVVSLAGAQSINATRTDICAIVDHTARCEKADRYYSLQDIVVEDTRAMSGSYQHMCWQNTANILMCRSLNGEITANRTIQLLGQTGDKLCWVENDTIQCLYNTFSMPWPSNASANQTPKIPDMHISHKLGENLRITLPAVDQDGDVLSYEFRHPRFSVYDGSATLEGNQLVIEWEPQRYMVKESIGLSAFDGELYSPVFEVVLFPQLDTPFFEVAGSTITLPEDTKDKVISTNLYNPMFLELSAQLTKAPSNGTARIGESDYFYYTPNENFAGQDLVEYQFSDSKGRTLTAQYVINVEPKNDRPVVQAQQLTLLEDQTLAIKLFAYDIEQQPVSFNVSQPENGTLIGEPPELTYLPNKDFYGTDSFQYSVYDGAITSETALIELTVNAVEDAPVAIGTAIEVTAGQTISFSLTASDGDQDGLTYNIVSQPSQGVVSGSAPELQFTTNQDFSGSDFLAFTASDGKQTSNIARVSFKTAKANNLPVANSMSLQVDEDSLLITQLTGLDPDGDALSFSIATAPNHGFAKIIGNELLYLPNKDFNGADQLTVLANDGIESSSAAIISIAVQPTNDRPVAHNIETGFVVNIASPVTLSGYDADSDELSFQIISQPKYGQLVGSPPNLTYLTNINDLTVDQFEFAVSDAIEQSMPATVTIKLNSAPVVLNKHHIGLAGAPIELNLDIFNAENDSLTYEVLTQPTVGQIVQVDGKLVFHAPKNVAGDTNFIVRASDGQQYSEPSQQTIQWLDVEREQLSVNEYHGCAIDDLGVQCWGRNHVGQLDLPSFNNPLSVAVGNLFSCVLDEKPDGQNAISCAGDDRYTDTSVVNLGNPVALYSAVNDWCAIVATDSSTSLHCQGSRAPEHQQALNAQRNITNVLLNVNTYCAVHSKEMLCQGTNANRFAWPPKLSGAVSFAPFPYNKAVACVLEQSENGTKQVCWGSSYDVKPVKDLSGATELRVNMQGESCALTGNSVRCSDNVILPSLKSPTNLTLGKDGHQFCVIDQSKPVCFWTRGPVMDTMPNLTIDSITGNNSTPVIGDTLVEANQGIGEHLLAYNQFDADGEFIHNDFNSSLDYSIAVTNEQVETGLQVSTWHDSAATHQYLSWANDGRSKNQQAILTLQLLPANLAPVVQNRTVYIADNQLTTLTLDARDPNGDTLTYELLNQPLMGQVELADNKLHITPNFQSGNEFVVSYQANDGFLASNTGQLTIRVTDSVEHQRYNVFADDGRGTSCVATDHGVQCSGDWEVPAYQYIDRSRSDVTAISLNNYVGCIVYNRQEVECFSNVHHSTTTEGAAYWNIPNISNASYIAVHSGNNACVIDAGQVKCWGQNNYQPPHFDRIDLLDHSRSLVCGLGAKNGKNVVQCWGSQATQFIVPDLTNPTDIAVSGELVCAIDNEQLVCWGRNGQSIEISEVQQALKIGSGINNDICAESLSAQNGRQLVCFDSYPRTITTSISSPVAQIFPMTGGICASTESGQTYCHEHNFMRDIRLGKLQIDDVQVNLPPSLATYNSPYYVRRGESIDIAPYHYDPDGDKVTFSKPAECSKSSTIDTYEILNNRVVFNSAKMKNADSVTNICLGVSDGVNPLSIENLTIYVQD